MIQKDYPAQLINPTNTAAMWNEINPVLLENEIGFESDTSLFKIGDGVSPWQALPYSRSSINEVLPDSGINIQDLVISTILQYSVIKELPDE